MGDIVYVDLKHILMRNEYMKSIFYLLMAATMGLCSCSSGGGEDEPVIPVQPQEKAKIEVTSSALSFEQEGGTATVTFTSNVAWTVSVSGSSWCSCTPASGSSGTCTVTVTVKENDTYEERTAQLNISGGTAKQSVKITQKGKVPTTPEGDIDSMPVQPL